MQQKLIKPQDTVSKFTIVITDDNTNLSIIDTARRQKVNKYM